jgi:hypothetical protein
MTVDRQASEAQELARKYLARKYAFYGLNAEKFQTAVREGRDLARAVLAALPEKEKP